MIVEPLYFRYTFWDIEHTKSIQNITFSDFQQLVRPVVIDSLLKLFLCHTSIGTVLSLATEFLVCLCLIMAALRSRCAHYIFVLYLWPPYGIGQAIIFLPCGFFFYLFIFFFPRLFLAVADWMSTILPHKVWPKCEFRMQVWNVLHAARWIYRTQKIVQNSSSGHHRTICRAICSQLRHISTIGKNC